MFQRRSTNPDRETRRLLAQLALSLSLYPAAAAAAALGAPMRAQRGSCTHDAAATPTVTRHGAAGPLPGPARSRRLLASMLVSHHGRRRIPQSVLDLAFAVAESVIVSGAAGFLLHFATSGCFT